MGNVADSAQDGQADGARERDAHRGVPDLRALVIRAGSNRGTAVGRDDHGMPGVRSDFPSRIDEELALRASLAWQDSDYQRPHHGANNPDPQEGD